MTFETVKKNLEKKGYQVRCFATGKEAKDYLDQEIDQKSVGIGGSKTIDEIGLYEALLKHNEVHWHLHMPEGKSDKEVRLAANRSAIYLSSINGLAETGEIVNIDGNCNRIAALLYGHEKVYFIVGKNKLAQNEAEALWRARNVAAPKNAQRLHRKTPCAIKADRCYNCQSGERICRGLSILWEKPSGADFEVVLIDEELGF